MCACVCVCVCVCVRVCVCVCVCHRHSCMCVSLTTHTPYTRICVYGYAPISLCVHRVHIYASISLAMRPSEYMSAEYM